MNQYPNKIELNKGEAHIIDKICVNSKYIARFLSTNEDYCQCSFGDCKVKVSISYNQHEPYVYILTEKEIQKLPVATYPNTGKERV